MNKSITTNIITNKQASGAAAAAAVAILTNNNTTPYIERHQQRANKHTYMPNPAGRQPHTSATATTTTTKYLLHTALSPAHPPSHPPTHPFHNNADATNTTKYYPPC